MLQKAQISVLQKICIFLIAICVSVLCLFGVNATPLNAGTATLYVGCDFATLPLVNTDYMVVISDLDSGKDVYSNVFNSNDYVPCDNVSISITSGHKYLIRAIAPAGYATQIWITDSVNEMANPMHTNSVVLEARDGVSYIIQFYLELQSLGWFDDFTIY